MEHSDLKSFTHDDLSNFSHLELRLKALEEIADTLSREELILPDELSNEIASKISTLSLLSDKAIHNLIDFIHLAKIVIQACPSLIGSHQEISILISIADELLQYFYSQKSNSDR